MLKILHAADLHLDSPFADGLRKGATRRARMRGAFANLILFAKERQVDLLLLSGDVFDGEFASKDTVSLLAREFSSIPACRVLIAPGNHDPFSPGSVWERAQSAFPDNVTVFSSPEITHLPLDDLGVDVYGYAFTSPTMEQSPLREFCAPAHPDRISILLAHADLGAQSPYAPISKELLAKTGVDYAALGHIHLPSELQRCGGVYYAYPGCLEGRGFDETGYKGALSVEIEKQGGITTVSATPKRFSLGRYEIAHADLSGALSESDALNRLRGILNEARLLTADTTLRLILEGSVAPGLDLVPAAQEAFGGAVYGLSVLDHTLPILDEGRLSEDLTIRGAYYRTLLPMLESEDPRQRETAARALTLGLNALRFRE